MIGRLFRSHKPSRPERPTFRPALESLENREVPSVADAQAAFFELPGATATLVGSLQARPTDAGSIQTNLANVTQDVLLLEYTARFFVAPDRLQIDNTLVVSGLTMMVQAFSNFPNFNGAQFVSVLRLGVNAVESGALDSLVTGIFPTTSNDAVL